MACGSVRDILIVDDRSRTAVGVDIARSEGGGEQIQISGTGNPIAVVV